MICKKSLAKLVKERMKRFACNFYLTYHCNFKCDHCCHCGDPQDKKFMSFEKLKFGIAWLHKVYQKTGFAAGVVGVTGGEPMTHPNFYNIV